jgi:hypothetical protein
MKSESRYQVFHLINTQPLTADEVFARISCKSDEEFLVACSNVRDSDHPLFFVRASLGQRNNAPSEQSPTNSIASSLTETDDTLRVTVDQLWKFALMK